MTINDDAHAGIRDLWPFGKSAEAEEFDPVPDPTPYVPNLAVVTDDTSVEKKLTNNSLLISRADNPPSGLSGLISRARQDQTNLTATLYENGFYAGQVQILIAGRPLSTVGPFDEIAERPVPVSIEVESGPEFRFGALDINGLPPGFVPEAHDFVTGEIARSAIVLRTEGALIDAWRELGHPLASVRPRAAVADHDTNTLDVTLTIDPGPVAQFGQATVEGAVDVDPDLIVGRANLDGPYSLKTQKRAEKRLRDLVVFDSARIKTGNHLNADGTLPTTIAVSERKKRVIGGAITYSDVEDFGGEIYWRHRNLFGGAEQLSLSASVSEILSDLMDPDYRIAGEFTKPGVLTPLTDLSVGAEAFSDETEAYEVEAFGGGVGLSHIFSDTITGSVGAQIVSSETTDDNGVTTDHLILSIPTSLLWDTRDDQLYPTTGFSAELLAEPSRDFEQETSFVRLASDLSVYRAVDRKKRTILAARAAAQVLTVDDVTDVAADRRIYLGGAGTVRGYAFENIAPRETNGSLIGGRSSILFSGEVRQLITDSFGVVGFVDVGSVSSSQTPDFDDIRVGVGLGVRYITPVGPLRVDFAVPLQGEQDDPDFAVLLGLGNAF